MIPDVMEAVSDQKHNGTAFDVCLKRPSEIIAFLTS